MNLRTVRVFVSSPSDTTLERNRLNLVADRLNRVLGGSLQIQTISWERMFYSAHPSFQEQTVQAAECDLVIAVFWSRLGTPLPENFARMESGERYPSGAAYEVLSALQARNKDDHPDVYVFRKTEPAVDTSDGKGQRKDLAAFFSRFFQTPDGERLRACHHFRTADEFEALVDKLLGDWVHEHFPPKQTLWPVEIKGSPFRGLQPFEAKHAPIYFGRDRNVTRAIERFQSVGRLGHSTRTGSRNVPFLLIVGETAVGKSSLMRAGLAPRLTAPGMVPGVHLWRTAIMNVGDDPDPFLTLAKALMVGHDDERGFGAALPELGQGGFERPEQLAELLARGAEVGEKRSRVPALAPIIKALAQVQASERQRDEFRRRNRANVLLLIDQLENIFAPEISEHRRAAFARLVFALASTRRVWVATTLRAEFYSRIIGSPDFFALKDAGATYDLPCPTSSDLIEILHRSAAAAGLVYEKHPVSREPLDKRILIDAQNNGTDALALLQRVLQSLFEAREVNTKAQPRDTCDDASEEWLLTYDVYEALNVTEREINRPPGGPHGSSRIAAVHLQRRKMLIGVAAAVLAILLVAAIANKYVDSVGQDSANGRVLSGATNPERSPSGGPRAP